MIRRTLFSIIRYFGRVWFALFPIKEQPKIISIKELSKTLSSLNKNRLVKFLIEILADKRRLIANADKNWRRNVKKYSKKHLIKAIINLQYLENIPDQEIKNEGK